MAMNEDILAAKILIVDDQPANVQLLTRLLAEAGYTGVTSTMDATAVQALYARHDHDLILLDLQMPVKDGFEVMQDLQDLQADGVSAGYLPVIVLTAQPAHKLRALQAGAKDFISKPFDLVEVKTRIYNMLEVRMLYQKLENYSKLLEFATNQRTDEMASAKY